MHHRVPDGLMWTFLLLMLAAASLPVYARIARYFEGTGAPLSPGGHVLAVIGAVVAGIVVVFLIMAVIVLFAIVVDFVKQKIRR